MSDSVDVECSLSVDVGSFNVKPVCGTKTVATQLQWRDELRHNHSHLLIDICRRVNASRPHI